ncbi:MAG: winged helix-turn-helix domain-containing protein [Candidatus Methanoperedens sp.]|nr:winged helix-turn-helix domain-containing protein [Candidatus Methanoperedens sp.]
MPENESDKSDEKLLILPLGEESKKITQVISNDTARQIIELLADAPLSASDIAERLHVPLTTIVYNLENLQNVGLIKVERIKYSEKGREVKIFAPVRKLIVVVPERTDKKSVADMLRKYMGVLLAAVFASSIVEFFMRSAGKNRVMNMTGKGGDLIGGIGAQNDTVTAVREVIPAQPPVATPAYAVDINATVTQAPASILDGGSVSNASPDTMTWMADTISAHPGLMFLLGCLFAVLSLVIWDYFKKKS